MSRPVTDGPRFIPTQGRFSRLIAAPALLLGLAGLPRSAEAQARPGSFSWVRAAGADTCPAREQLALELDRALGKPLASALDGRAVEGVITRGSAGWDVTLYWRAADGTGAGTREIHDDSPGCEGIARNVVASITVALTAGAVDAPSRPPAPTPPEPPKPPPPTAPSAAPVEKPPPAAPEPILPADRTHVGAVMLGAVITVGWVPGVGYGIQLVAEPIVSGRFRLTSVATALAEATQRLQGVSVGFSAVEFGSDLCAVLLAHPRHWIEAGVCGGARAGVIQTSVYNGLQNAGGAQGSFALELGGELRSNPLGPVWLDLHYSGRLNATQYVLGRAGSEPVYKQDLVGFVAVLRMGVQFP